MGFWIYMLVTVLFIPLVMIIFGAIMRKSAPKDINYLLGYRTARSMKNQDTWQFAHKICGRIWLRVGIVMLPVSVVAMLFCLGKSKDAIGNAGLGLMFAQLAALMLSIIPTESALKKAFDEDGNRR